MFIISVLVTFLLPIQVHPNQGRLGFPDSLWAVQTIIDSSKIIGIGNYYYRKTPENFNPELYVRQPNPDDKPMNRRKQFIQELVNQTSYIQAK
jgi:hypothetical protein